LASSRATWVFTVLSLTTSASAISGFDSPRARWPRCWPSSPACSCSPRSASAAIAPSQGVASGSWYGLNGLAEAASDYASALLGVCAWALFGMAIAVFVRSIPVALGIGIVWAGPLEHILQDSWTSADRWFPGLLLESLTAGGTDDVALGRALALVGVYVAVAVSAAAVMFARRDVTG